MGFPGGLVVKNLPAMQKTQVRFLGQEDPLEKRMVTHSILAWEIPWTEELAGCSPWGRKELNNNNFSHQISCLIAGTLFCSREDQVKLAKSEEVVHVLGGRGQDLVFLRMKDQGPVEDKSSKQNTKVEILSLVRKQIIYENLSLEERVWELLTKSEMRRE